MRQDGATRWKQKWGLAGGLRGTSGHKTRYRGKLRRQTNNFQRWTTSCVYMLTASREFWTGRLRRCHRSARLCCFQAARISKTNNWTRQTRTNKQHPGKLIMWIRWCDSVGVLCAFVSGYSLPVCVCERESIWNEPYKPERPKSIVHTKSKCIRDHIPPLPPGWMLWGTFRQDLRRIIMQSK